MMAPSKDCPGTLGFRCVVGALQNGVFQPSTRSEALRSTENSSPPPVREDRLGSN